MQRLRHLVAVSVSAFVTLSGTAYAIEVGQVSESQPPAISPPTNTIPPGSERRTTNPAPAKLIPDPNPLLFPTKPEEVQIVGTQPITLQQALELSRRNNRSLQVVQLQLEQARAALRQAQAAQSPTLSLSSNLTFQDSAQGEFSNRQQDLRPQTGLAALLNQDSNRSSTTTSLPFNSSVELSYNLYTSGRTEALIRASERQVRLNELEVERQAEQLRLDTTNDYYALQEADEQVRIARAAVNNAQQSLRDAQALERAGVGTRFDVLRAQVQLANANQDLTRAEAQQVISRRQLSQRLSIPQGANVSAADPVQVSGLWNLPLEDSIVLAFKNRAELEQQLVQREVGEAQRQAELAATGPQVALVANYNILNILDASPNPGLADGYAIGARLTWNFYDGGAAQARADQQTLNIRIAEQRFADNRNQIRFQVEQAYSNLQANFANIQTTAIALEQARESLRLARLRFQAGVGTQTDVINAETELTRAEANRLRAILDYNRALAALQRAISNLDTNTLGAS
ncbi:MAG: TolC family protein [Leptolyngbyaceae cyanobacterium bins.59]|nr:TolC family protein [Leptolyngbyaceae cyanobacterium bins.59]